jgi:hypothetical protein
MSVFMRREQGRDEFVISLFHMVAFAALMTAGLKFVSTGRTIVLGCTTPLWVASGAWLCATHWAVTKR